MILENITMQYIPDRASFIVACEERNYDQDGYDSYVINGIDDGRSLAIVKLLETTEGDNFFTVIYNMGCTYICITTFGTMSDSTLNELLTYLKLAYDATPRV